MSRTPAVTALTIALVVGGLAVAPVANAAEPAQEAPMSFDLQSLRLQTQMQNQNRSSTAVSNIMKTKPDTVKNSIANVR